MLLSIHGLRVHYGKAEAIRDISIDIDRGEIVTIVGANGAGKTTLLRTISGLKKATKGEIVFKGIRIDTYPAERIVKVGIAHSPEGRHIFPLMSVYDNLILGSFLRTGKTEVNRDLEAVFGHFPILRHRLRQRAGSLSGGEQQMLTIGRALMAKPVLLLLDEPSLGLAPRMVAEIGRIVRNINQDGVSIILVEQNASMALIIAQRAYVLEIGRVVLSGSTRDLMGNEDVRRAFLGG
jgi:branched-chain amino acid transport system ATP-binding protein